MPRIIENRLIAEFKNRKPFSRKELYEFFREFEPDLKEGTLAWRIYDLKKKNIIKTLKKGLYVLSYKPEYNPEVSPKVLKLAKKINDRFENIKYCIWETAWLNEFTQHQSSKRIILIEIEKDFVESLYYELKDFFRDDLFLNPDEKAIDFYIAESNYPIVIKKLISRSPTSKRIEKKVTFYTPLLEKLLVDLVAEEKFFFFYQGSEMMHIYENAFKNYSINFTKLFSYAKRREREMDIKAFLKINMSHLVKDMIDD